MYSKVEYFSFTIKNVNTYPYCKIVTPQDVTRIFNLPVVGAVTGSINFKASNGSRDIGFQTKMSILICNWNMLVLCFLRISSISYPIVDALSMIRFLVSKFRPSRHKK